MIFDSPISNPSIVVYDREGRAIPNLELRTGFAILSAVRDKAIFPVGKVAREPGINPFAYLADTAQRGGYTIWYMSKYEGNSYTGYFKIWDSFFFENAQDAVEFKLRYDAVS